MTDRYAEAMQSFRWRVPEDFNIGRACMRWAGDPARVALHAGSASWTYRRLADDADRLSRALQDLGVERGDRIAMVLPQCPDTIVAHMAIHRIAAVAMPLSLLFGPEALAYRLQDSGAVVAIVAMSGVGPFVDPAEGVRTRCPDLRRLIVVGDDVPDDADRWQVLIDRTPR